MWVLIFSELAVFGAGLAAFMAVRLTDPAGFAAAQSTLMVGMAGVNTIVLVTSGLFAALATISVTKPAARMWLLAASMLGAVFLWLKGVEYAGKSAAGITFETHSFFTFYYLLTGFHAAHVVAGIVMLALVGWQAQPRIIQTGVAFWHMVDLVWVLLFPVIYLL
ncbi:Cytochrome c oxidase subunit 3 [Roseobacter fucihabitans]|uniref:Cytochrome c oxidase subunit 3 n=1 Tax=Roseobacter fucihabitans TaxID=1537242 RepID=A0ABZ2BM12_9RHOB|nr:cytochrome c oxidase subunit 3 [Roseobacter litoralis]MBC6963466.1 Cytochrome c oxidase subunit 3 [Roseobacter litoralis]